MDDLISRQQAIDEVQRIGRLATLEDSDAVIRMSAVEYILFNLPSVKVEVHCNTCRYRNLSWSEDPCDSCTVTGNANHYKPVAEVELLERKHGEWIVIWDSDDPNTSTHARCSVCGVEQRRPVGCFCKWCGADMRGEQDG